MSNIDNVKRYKEARQNLIKDTEENNVDFLSGKKYIFVSLLAIIINMFFNMVIGFVFFVYYDIPIEANNIFMFVMPLLLSFIFARFIYFYGTKLFVFLFIVGGAASLLFSFINDSFLYLNTESILLNITNIYAIIGSVIQITLGVFLLLNKKCRTYISLISDIDKKVKTEYIHNLGSTSSFSKANTEKEHS